MDQSVRRAATRLLAAFLALSLMVPNPAFALRNESVEGSGLEELDRTLRQIGRAVGLVPNLTPPPSASQPIPSAGMEERFSPAQIEERIQTMWGFSMRLTMTWFRPTPERGKMRSFQETMRALFEQDDLRIRLAGAGLNDFEEISRLYWGDEPPSLVLSPQQEFLFLVAPGVLGTFWGSHVSGADWADRSNADVLENVMATSGPLLRQMDRTFSSDLVDELAILAFIQRAKDLVEGRLRPAGMEEARPHVNIVDEDSLRNFLLNLPGLAGLDTPTKSKMAGAVIRVRKAKGPFQGPEHFVTQMGNFGGVGKKEVWGIVAKQLRYGAPTGGGRRWALRILGLGTAAALVAGGAWLYRKGTTPGGRVIWVFDYHGPADEERMTQILRELKQAGGKVYVAYELAPPDLSMVLGRAPLRDRLTRLESLDDPATQEILWAQRERYITNSRRNYSAQHPGVIPLPEEAPRESWLATLRMGFREIEATVALYQDKNRAGFFSAMAAYYREHLLRNRSRDESSTRSIVLVMQNDPGATIVVFRGFDHQGMEGLIRDYGSFRSEVRLTPRPLHQNPLTRALQQHEETILEGALLPETAHQAAESFLPWQMVGEAIVAGSAQRLFGDQMIVLTDEVIQSVIQAGDLPRLTEALQTHSDLFGRIRVAGDFDAWYRRAKAFVLAWLNERGHLRQTEQYLPASLRGLRLQEVLRQLRQSRTGMEEKQAVLAELEVVKGAVEKVLGHERFSRPGRERERRSLEETLGALKDHSKWLQDSALLSGNPDKAAEFLERAGAEVAGAWRTLYDPQLRLRESHSALAREEVDRAVVFITARSWREALLHLASKPESGQPPASGMEEASLAKFQAELARPEVTGGQGIRGRVLTGPGHTYDVLVLDQFPSELVPALTEGLSPLVASLDEGEPFTWVDAAGGLGAALKEGSLRFKNLSPLLVDAVRWTREQFDPDTLAKLEASAASAGVDLWTGEVPLIQENVQTADLRRHATAPIRLITMMNALAYNADPLKVVANLFNQLEPEGILLLNLYIPTRRKNADELPAAVVQADEQKADALAGFYRQLGSHLKAQGVEADFRITDWRKENRLTAEQEQAPFPEYSVGMVLKRGRSQELHVTAQPQSEPFPIQTVRTVTYQVAWYGDDPADVIQVTAAGMEETLDPQVRSALLEFQAEDDPSRRLSVLEERLRNFQPAQRAQFLNGLPWLPDQARTSQLVVAAFRENRSLGEQLLNAFRAVLQEERENGRPLFDQLSALRLLLERGSFEDARAIREGVTAMLADQTGRNFVSSWEDIAGEIYTLAVIGPAEAAIRQYQRDVEDRRLQQGRPPQSDFYAERYLRMGENHEQLSDVYRGLVGRLAPGDEEELLGRLREEGGFEIIQKAVGQQLSSEGLSPHMRQAIDQGLPATVYEWMEKALRLRIQNTPDPLVRWVTLQRLIQLEESFGDYLKARGEQESSRHYAEALKLRTRLDDLIRERQRMLGLSPSAGMEEEFRRLLRRDGALRQEIQEKGGAWLNLNQVRAFGERYAAGLVVGPEAKVTEAGFVVYSDKRLGNERAEGIFSWIKKGEGAEDVARHAAEARIEAGDLLILREEGGLTPDKIQSELRHNGIASVRVVVGNEAQVRELPPYAFERIAKDPRGQPVLFLSVAVRLQDEAGNTYTLILMA